MSSIRHIFVATDFGPASQRALVTATEMAITFNAKVTVFHVLEAPSPMPELAELQADPNDTLNSIVATLRTLNLECAGRLDGGEPWRAIVRAARELRADLVIVGSHGRRGMARGLLGSVAEKVARYSSVPVLTVHAHWFEDRTHAGRELAKQLTVLRASKPAVLALSRGAIAIASEIASSLDAPLDILLSRELRDGGTVFGALCEDGTVRLSAKATKLAELSEEREKILIRARAALDREALDLRGVVWFDDLQRRTVVLVSDVLMAPWTALAAVAAVRKMGADRVVVAAPLASDAVVRTLESDTSNAVVVHTIPAESEPSSPYRTVAEPSTRALLDAIHRAPSPSA